MDDELFMIKIFYLIRMLCFYLPMASVCIFFLFPSVSGIYHDDDVFIMEIFYLI